jgi:hypothetical protein
MLLFPQIFAGQSAPWHLVSTSPDRPVSRPAQLTPSETTAIRHLLSSPDQKQTWDCETGNSNAEWLQDLRFSILPVNPSQRVLLAEAGAGCARGGQGANGAMWAIRFDGERPRILASPAYNFNGWLYSLSPSSSHGYRDIVLGWHLGAGEAGLTYFRFNGRQYRQIGSAQWLGGADSAKIVPNPQPANLR